MRTPPATLTNTSAAPPAAPGGVTKPAGGARADPGVAAEDGEHERETVAVDPVGDSAGRDDLGWRDERLDLDQERPGALHGGEDDAARGPGRLAHEPRGRVLDLDEAGGLHLEHADVVGRAEAVLQRPQGAIGPLPFTLELQHAVDEMLEHARAGQRALLRDVADQQHGHAALLREPRDPVGDLAHLADGARRAGEV